MNPSYYPSFHTRIRSFWKPFLLVLMLPLPSLAVRPFAHNLALVAGDGNPGFQDGDFTSAFFHKPSGIALSLDGSRLFVADTDNNRIRVIHLDQDNKVTTLCGQDAAGDKDGPLASTLFNQPQGVVCLPEERLVVNDRGNKLLRLVDLKAGTVTTLMGTTSDTAGGPASAFSLEGLQGMAYLPSANSLVFSQPEQGSLKALDLKTNQVSVILQGQAGLAHPTFLCVSGKRLFAADRDQNQVFEVQWTPGSTPSVGPVATTNAKVLSLAGANGSLYAIQANVSVPLLKILPQQYPVTFLSVWEGEAIPEPGTWLATFYDPNPANFPGMAADPSDSGKLYITNPNLHFISSFREPSGATMAGEAYDSEFPTKKPARAFRILLVGDSRSCMIVNYKFKPTPFSFQQFPRSLNLANRLGLELNTLGSLENAPKDFQVLSLCHSASQPLFLWSNYEAPDMAQKNDVDLVILLQPLTPSQSFPFDAYYTRPMTKQGIPSGKIDPEYLLKPPQDRIPAGDARRFFELCKAKKWVKLEGNNVQFSDLMKGSPNGELKVSKQADPEIYDALVNLLGKPLGLLSQKLSGIKNSAGEPVRFLLCFTPTASFRPCPEEAELWRGVAEKYKLSFLDLSPEMKALRLSYFPLGEAGGNDHFDINGNVFFGRLLAHVLVREGLVPWSKSPSK